MQNQISQVIRKGSKQRFLESRWKIDDDGQEQTFYLEHKGKAKPIALLVATKAEDGTVVIDWSHCHKKDVFDRKIGMAIALHKAEIAPHARMTHEVKKALPQFVERCCKYFRVEAEAIKVRGVRTHATV